MTSYGYFRCSTNLQDEERQIRALKDAKVDFINGDKITGTSNFNSRPELSKLLKKMDSGSVLVISELSRLSRSFLGMVNEISEYAVDFKEDLLDEREKGFVRVTVLSRGMQEVFVCFDAKGQMRDYSKKISRDLISRICNSMNNTVREGTSKRENEPRT